MNRTRYLLPLLLTLCVSAPAQVDDESANGGEEAQAQAADSDPQEEIVVVGQRPGDPRRLDNAYEEALRNRILEEIDRLEALEEEFDWRREAPTGDDGSRIRWGYDPRDEYRTRRESELYDLPMESTRPATIFSIEF